MLQNYNILFQFMEVLGKKWVVPLLIFLLFYEKTNFSHMKKQLKITSKDLSKKFSFKMEFAGQRPRASEIRYAKLGEIDSLIRQLAYDEDATLLTGDKIQARVALAKGIKCILLKW